jgi:hypothetical protein
MDARTYRFNVFRTLSQKGAKAGLRHIAGNTARTDISHAIVGLSTEVGELITGLEDYLLGTSQYKESHRENVMEELGDIGYYLIVGAKVLKLKVAGTGKKTALHNMTRAKAIFTLHRISTDLLDLFKKNFYGVNPDKTAQEAKDAERLELMKGLFTNALTLYWQLCFDMLGETPAVVFQGNIAKLSKRYPDGMFCKDAQEMRDKLAEMVAMKKAAKEAKVVAGEGTEKNL